MMTESKLPERSSLAVSAVKLASRAFLFPFFKIKIRGVNNIPEKDSFVLLPKHQRWEDIPLIAISIKRPLYFIAKQELFDNFISKRFIAMLGGLPINRSRPGRSRSTLTTVIKKLGEGEGLVVFPEGTYYKNQMGPLHTGFIRMIYSNINTCFIPVGIKYSKKKRRTFVDIAFGKPVDSEVLYGTKDLRSFIMEKIARLSGFR